MCFVYVVYYTKLLPCMIVSILTNITCAELRKTSNTVKSATGFLNSMRSLLKGKVMGSNTAVIC